MVHLRVRRARQRARRVPRALLLVLAGVASLVVVAVPAAAAPAVDNFVVSVESGSPNLGGFHIDGFAPTLPPSGFDLDVTAEAVWSGDITTDVGWDTDDVRQGQTLDVSRVSPASSGHIEVHWTVEGTVSPLGIADVDIGPLNLSKDVTSCEPAFSGGGFTGTATSDGLTLHKTPGIPLSPYVKLAIQVAFDVTPEGTVVTRGFSIGVRGPSPACCST
jgi:hypothetical protein